MAKLKVFSVCTYLTEVGDVTWRQDDWDANRSVKLLKEEPFNGYLEIRDGGKSERLTADEAKKFHPIVHSVLAERLKDEVGVKSTLVPIPNSHVISPDTPNFRTRSLAEGIAAKSDGLLECMPSLVFCEELPKTHQTTGQRDPRYLRDKYRILEEPSSPIILVDDIFTSGAHLIGAAWKFSEAECDVDFACTWAKATREQRERVWQWCEDELDLSDTSPDFSSIFNIDF